MRAEDRARPTRVTRRRVSPIRDTSSTLAAPAERGHERGNNSRRATPQPTRVGALTSILPSRYGAIVGAAEGSGEATWPQDSRSPGVFLLVQRRAEVARMSEITERHYLRNGARDAGRRARGARVGVRDARGDGRPQVLRLLGIVAARVAADHRLRGERVRRGARLRRLVHPWLAGDPGLGHAPHAGRLLSDPRSRDRGADALARLRDRRPDHARALREGSARRREAGRGVPAARPASPTRRTSVPSASSSSSTRSRTSSARTARTTRSTRPRGTGTRASPGSGTRPGRRRATSRRAVRHAPRSPHRDGAHARAARHPVRVPPPRGRVRRPVRDRPPLRDAHADGRPGHDLQVRRQERRAQQGQDA